MSQIECAFCGIVNGTVNTEKIYENDGILSVLSKPPTPAGHSIIFPKRHVLNFSELDPAEQVEFSRVWGMVELALITLLKKPRAINLKSGGFIEHFHLHLYAADQNTPWSDVIGMFENRVNADSDPQNRSLLLLQLRQILKYDPLTDHPVH